MRIVLIGAHPLALASARLFLEQNHQVVIIEQNEEEVARLSKELDCSFVVGDGSRPSVLREVGPKNTDFLFCLTTDDQVNIIASLVGHRLGFGRVITVLRDTDYEPICAELGLDGAIFLDWTIARNFLDIVRGMEFATLSAALKGGLRFFSFVVPAERAGDLASLEMPEGSRVIAVTRDGNSRIADATMTVKKDDELLVIATGDRLDALREIFSPDQPAEK